MVENQRDTVHKKKKKEVPFDWKPIVRYNTRETGFGHFTIYAIFKTIVAKIEQTLQKVEWGHSLAIRMKRKWKQLFSLDQIKVFTQMYNWYA